MTPPRTPEAAEPHLTPTEDLLLGLLAARHRLEDTPYHLENRHLRTLRSLAAKGLIGYQSGTVAGCQKAWLTDAGVTAAIDPDHCPPALSPTCRSAYFGPRSAGFRVDCERRNHHGGKHRAPWWKRGKQGDMVQTPLRWTDADAWGADNPRYAHLHTPTAVDPPQERDTAPKPTTSKSAKPRKGPGT